MKIFLGIILIFIVICIISWIVDTHRYVVRKYSIEDSRVKGSIRFALVTDLHNKEYGRGNEKLISSIKDNKPDAIIIGGDLLNGIPENDFSVAVNFLKSIKALGYPIYYGMGNHEYRLRLYPEKYGTMWADYTAQIEKLGVHILDNEHVFLPNHNIDIAGLSIDRKFYKRFSGYSLTEKDVEEYIGLSKDEAYQIVIAHNPEYFDAYARWQSDLTLSGHVHGGVMRLPFVGGIVSPRVIKFPKYSGGLYEKKGKKIIVSCGLGTHTIHVRVFNPGELAIIDINGSKS